MKRNVSTITAIVALAGLLLMHPALSLGIKPAKGCGECDYCRMKIEGVDQAKVKEISSKVISETRATENGMMTISTLSDEYGLALFREYHLKRQEKKNQLDKAETTKACECCDCYGKANARNAGKLVEEAIPFKNGIIQLVTSQDRDEVKKLHERVEKINRAAK